MLQLPNTAESNKAAVPVTLLPPKRQTLYVHSNLVEAHFVNSDQEQIIRVINNNNIKDGKQVLLSFTHPHYYRVGKKYFRNINTFITDSFSAEPLLFSNPVSYLLHFRP